MINRLSDFLISFEKQLKSGRFDIFFYIQASDDQETVLSEKWQFSVKQAKFAEIMNQIVQKKHQEK